MKYVTDFEGVYQMAWQTLRNYGSLLFCCYIFFNFLVQATSLTQVFEYEVDTPNGEILFHPNQPLIAINDGNEIIIINYSTLEIEHILNHSINPQPEPINENDVEQVTTMLFDPNGDMLFSGSGFSDYFLSDIGSLQVWNVSNGESLPTLDTGASISNMTINSDGTLLAYTRSNEEIRILETATGETIITLLNPSRSGGLPLFNPSLNMIGYLTRGAIDIVNIDSEETFSLGDLDDNISQFLFNPQGTLIVTLGETLSIWDSVNGDLEMSLEMINPSLAEFSLDGHLLATSVEGTNTISVWEIDTGELIAEFTGHDTRIIDISFNNNGNQVVSVDLDSIVKVWDVDTEVEVDTGELVDTIAILSVEFTSLESLIVTYNGALLQIWQQ